MLKGEGEREIQVHGTWEEREKGVHFSSRAPEFPLPIPLLTPATQAIKTAGQRQL